MRNFILFFITVFLFLSCSSDDDTSSTSVNLTGTWWKYSDKDVTMDLGFYTDSTCVINYTFASSKATANYKCRYQHPNITLKPTSSKYNTLTGVVDSDKKMIIKTTKDTFTFTR